MDGIETAYCVASRSTSSSNGTYYALRFITTEGSLNSGYVYYVNTSSSDSGVERKYSVRPILTLKADINVINGDGSSANASYQLS